MRKPLLICMAVVTSALGLGLWLGLSAGDSRAADVRAKGAGDAAVTANAPGLEEVAQAEPTSKIYEEGDVHVGSSRVYVFVGKTGFGHEHGIEGQLRSGTLFLDDNDTSSKLVFDMSSFTADTPAARKYVGLKGETDANTRRKVTNNMLGADVLNARKYSTAEFTITSVAPTKQAGRNGEPQYQIDGKFTLHGKTRNIRFLATAVSKGDWSHVRGRFSILQTDYGIEPYSTALGAIGVADKLTIWGDLWVAKTRVAVKQTKSRQ